MKYTNEHIKESYFLYKVSLYIFSVGIGLGITLLLWGFITVGIQMNNIAPLDAVLTQYSNPANKTAYLEIVEVPQKIAEDKYESYYLVRTETEIYISGMQEEQYAALKEEVVEKGKIKLEGMTKVIIDEQVLENVAEYLNKEHIHLRATELSYSGVLKEGYIVNLILGGLFTLFSLAFIFGSNSELKKYENPQAKQIDEECNRDDSKWLGEYKIYLTNSFLMSIYNGLTAIDIDAISSVILYNTKQGDVIMNARKIDGSTIKIFEDISKDVYIYEEEKNYLETIFGSRNIKFICEMEILNDDESECEEEVE